MKIRSFSLPLFLYLFFAHVSFEGGQLLANDYKVNERGKIKLSKKNKDPFDRLIAISNKKEKIRYNHHNKPIQDFIQLEKGILNDIKYLKASQDDRYFRGLRINFDIDESSAQAVFEFLADHTYVEWSMVNFGNESGSRSHLYTSFRKDLEFFGARKSFHLANASNIHFLKHYHNHPRYPVESVGKYNFPSDSDLDFRNHLLKKNLAQLVLKIRTEGKYLDYGNPIEWNKGNNDRNVL